MPIPSGWLSAGCRSLARTVPAKSANSISGYPSTSLRLENQDTERELASEGIVLAPGILLASARTLVDGDLTRTRACPEGRVFIQDEASQLVAALVGTGSRLLDCCAAPGGKTAAIAWRNPAAEIIAVGNARAPRGTVAQTSACSQCSQVIRLTHCTFPLAGGFDRVLADVPCSGTGTLARNPDIKWRLTEEDLSELHAKQVAILRAALQQLAPGGRAVYSTCSLEREENEAVVEEVLRDAEDYGCATVARNWKDCDRLASWCGAISTRS